MINNNKVEDFINNFKGLYKKETEEMYLFGLCYWFSFILSNEFKGIMYYDMVKNHFITKIKGHFYDIRGNIDKLYKNYKDIIKWEKYCKIEPLDSKRVVKYCKNLIKD